MRWELCFFSVSELLLQQRLLRSFLMHYLFNWTHITHGVQNVTVGTKSGVSECGSLSLLASGIPGYMPPSNSSFPCGHTMHCEDLVTMDLFAVVEKGKVNAFKSIKISSNLTANLVFSVVQRFEYRKWELLKYSGHVSWYRSKQHWGVKSIRQQTATTGWLLHMHPIYNMY